MAEKASDGELCRGQLWLKAAFLTRRKREAAVPASLWTIGKLPCTLCPGLGLQISNPCKFFMLVRVTL